MSDAPPVQITSGRAIAVDTDSLRHAGERFHAVARQLDDLAESLRQECARLQTGAGSWGWALPGRMFAVPDAARALADRADRLGAQLTHAAEVYEVVELRARMHQADAVGDVQAGESAAAALHALTAADPTLLSEAERIEDAYGARVADEDHRVAGIPVVGGLAGIAVTLLGRGRMVPGMTGSAAAPVRVHRVGAPAAGHAPADLADLVGRIPSGAHRPLVRVERYTMPDASRRFLVYVTGTRDMSLTRTTDPSDMQSNLRLYRGESSASLVAVQRALSDAGARPGDIVNPVGHSQGGMIAGRLALDGGYRTTMIVTAGSPTEAQVPRNVLSVQLEHPDVVSDLNAGGTPGQVGSSGSMVIRRDLHPGGGALAAHDLSRYVETAREADRSADPRMGGIQHQLAQMRDATRVDVTEYDAEVVVPDAGEPHPAPTVPAPTAVPGLDGRPFVGAERG